MKMITLTIAASLLVASSANAGLRRDDCANPARAGYRGAQMGVRNAQRLFGAIWSRLGRTCDQLDRLGSIISDTPFARPAMGGEFAACFYKGYTDTLWDELAYAYDRCQVRCFNEGSEIGNISAQGYCAASIAVGGLDDPGFISQPPLPFCGANLVFGCKSQYISTATRHVPGCYPFTTGYFAETFDNSVRLDCFVPTDVPIRDWLTLLDGTTINLGSGSTYIATALR